MIQSTFSSIDLPAGENFTIACSEQPQERLEAFGVAALSDTELIAIILQSGTRGHSVLKLASQLIAQAGSIAGLASWQPEDFRRLKGIGRTKGLQLATLAEISRRMMASYAPEMPMMDRSELVAAHFAPLVIGLQVEKFWVLCLNRKHRLLKRVEVTSGTATSALAHPREVFRAAVRESACAIVCVHNHPSGDPAPSAPDMHVTRVLREAAKAVDIPLLDHVIVGTPAADPLARGHFSFREAGIL